MSNFFKSVSLVSCMTLISRVFGFARDLIAAQIFGVTAAVDAFYIAFKIPNFMRNLFAEGSFSQAFVPILADYQQNHPQKKIMSFISNMAGTLATFLLIITVIGIYRAQDLITLFSPGLDLYRFNLATTMLRITFPYIMLISLTAFAGSILNNYGKFGIPAFTPTLLNICLIITAISFSHCFNIPIMSQALGVLIAGFAQLIMQLVTLYRTQLLVMPKFNLHDNGVKAVLKSIVPALFGASVGQISILLNTILASFLVIGSISWLYYAERLTYFPLGIFGVALTTVLLPHLSRQHAIQSKNNFLSALEWGLRWNLIIGIPASITMLVLAEPMIISLFKYGKFTVHDVIMIKKCVIAYGIGLQAFMLAKILSAAFYAQKDIKTPVKISIITLISNIMLSLILIRPLAHVGLALSTSISSWINVIILWAILYRRNHFAINWKNWSKFFIKLFITNIILIITLYFISWPINTWLNWPWWERLLHITIIGFTAIITYILCLFITQAYPKH